MYLCTINTLMDMTAIAWHPVTDLLALLCLSLEVFNRILSNQYPNNCNTKLDRFTI